MLSRKKSTYGLVELQGSHSEDRGSGGPEVNGSTLGRLQRGKGNALFS